MDKLTEENLRIDKWLWAVRIFKTRSVAANACKKNQVNIGGVNVKPSRIVNVGEKVVVKTPEMKRVFLVKGLLAKRQSAKVVVDYVEDVTPQEEIDKVRAQRMVRPVFREPGQGRPSKKDRRDMEQFGYIQE